MIHPCICYILYLLYLSAALVLKSIFSIHFSSSKKSMLKSYINNEPSQPPTMRWITALQIFTWSKNLYENWTKRQRYNSFSEGKNYNPMKHCKLHDQIKNRKSGTCNTVLMRLGPSLGPNISEEHYLLESVSIPIHLNASWHLCIWQMLWKWLTVHSRYTCIQDLGISSAMFHGYSVTQTYFLRLSHVEWSIFTTTHLTTAQVAILRPIQKMVTGKISNI